MMQPKPLINMGKIEEYRDRAGTQITQLSPDLDHAMRKCVEAMAYGAKCEKLSMWIFRKMDVTAGSEVLTVMQP